MVAPLIWAVWLAPLWAFVFTRFFYYLYPVDCHSSTNKLLLLLFYLPREETPRLSLVQVFFNPICFLTASFLTVKGMDTLRNWLLGLNYSQTDDVSYFYSWKYIKSESPPHTSSSHIHTSHTHHTYFHTSH